MFIIWREQKKDRIACRLCGKTVSAPGFVGRDHVVDSAEGLLALLDTVFFHPRYFFFQIKSHIHNFNITNRNDYSCLTSRCAKYHWGNTRSRETNTNKPEEHKSSYKHSFFILGSVWSPVLLCTSCCFLLRLNEAKYGKQNIILNENRPSAMRAEIIYGEKSEFSK